MSLMTDKAWKLCQRENRVKPGAIQGEHIKFSVTLWKEAVLEDKTREGYWNWVASKVSEEKD